jgi:hypothetical protein
MEKIKYLGIGLQPNINTKAPVMKYFVSAPKVALNRDGGTKLRVPSSMGRTASKFKNGKESTSGNFEIPFDIQLGNFLTALNLGGYEFDDLSGIHYLYGSESKELKYLTLVVGKETYAEEHIGVANTQIAFAMSDGFLMMTNNVMGSTTNKVPLKTIEEITPLFPEAIVNSLGELDVLINGVSLNVRDYKLDVNQNGSANYYTKSTKPGDIKGEARNVSLTLTIPNENTTYYDMYISGETINVEVIIDSYTYGTTTIKLPTAYIDTHSNDIAETASMNQSFTILTTSSLQTVGSGQVYTDIIVEVDSDDEDYFV